MAARAPSTRPPRPSGSSEEPSGADGGNRALSDEDKRRVKDEFKRFMSTRFPPRATVLEDVRRILDQNLDRRLIINFNDWLHNSPALAQGCTPLA